MQTMELRSCHPKANYILLIFVNYKTKHNLKLDILEHG